MSEPTALHYRSLDEVAAAIRRGETTSEEITRHALGRIAALDGELHAFAEVRNDGAMADARERDARRASGAALGTLHGVPVAVKDLCAMAGTATRAGGRFDTFFAATDTATVVARLEAAGAVIVGKAQLTEGAWGSHHPDVPPPVNPWSPAHWPGASSSGSGVSVAAGMAWAALGTDTAVSIRFPSASCHLVGLKPTWGRVSRHGVFPLSDTLDHVGPMARTVVDAALVYETIAGADPRDPTSLQEPVGEVVAAARSGSLRGVRLGLDRGYALDNVDPTVAAALEAAIATMRDAGAVVVDVDVPPVPGILERAAESAFVEAAISHARTFPSQVAVYGPELRAILDHGRSVPATRYAEIAIWRREFASRLATIFRDVDVIVAPVMPIPTPPVELMRSALGDGNPLGGAPLLGFTIPFNLAGVPTLTLPMGPTKEGVPMGFQLIGPALSEARLLAAGAGWEKASGFAERHAPV